MSGLAIGAAVQRVGIDIRDFNPGAPGSDISSAITAALAQADATYGALIDLCGLKAGVYGLHGVTINQPAITLRTATHVVLTKGANGSMLTIGALAESWIVDHPYFEGAGGTFSGASLTISGQAGSGKLIAPRLYNSLTYAIDFSAAGAGARFQCSDGHFNTYLGADGQTNDGQASIHLPNDSGNSVNRTFVDCSFEGYIASIDGGNENTKFVGGVGNNFTFTGRANKFLCQDMRITPLSHASVTFNTLSGIIAGGSIAGDVIVGGTSADTVFGPLSCASLTFNSGTGDPAFKLPNYAIGITAGGGVVDNGNNRIVLAGGDTAYADALKLDGTTGNYAKAVDSAALSIVGDIEFRAKIAPTTWTPGATMNVVNKWDPSGGNGKSYIFGILSSGKVFLYWNDIGGTSHFPDSGTAVGFSANQAKWIRGTLDVDNGATGNTVTFYTSDDGVTWVALGSPVVTAGVTTILDAAAAVEIGSQDHGSSGNYAGKIFRAQIYNGIAGTLVADFNPGSVAIRGTRQPTLHADSVAQQWVMQGSAWDWTRIERDTGQNGGQATFSGNSVLTAFAIPHKLQATPRIVHVNPGSAAANGVFSVTADATNVTVTYAVAPATASNNVVLWWEAKL